MNYHDEVAVSAVPYNPPEKKKVGFFTRWFDRKCKEAWERNAQNNGAIGINKAARLQEAEFNVEGLNIRLYGATGGHIVEFRKYDRHKDRTDNRLYIINSEQNFSEQFAKVVTLEMFR